MRFRSRYSRKPKRPCIRSGWPRLEPMHSVLLMQFIHTCQDKYPKATECLEKGRKKLLAFYDFPAMHWLSLRTTNPIESTFATILKRTRRSKGCLSRMRMLCMMFKLGLCAQHKLAQVARIQATRESDRRNKIQRRD